MPPLITEICGQKRVPFGDGAIIEIKDNVIDSSDLQASLGVLRIGFEICEELWHSDTQSNRHFGLRACHLVVNPSSSYWELRKLDNAYNHVRSVTSKTGTRILQKKNQFNQFKFIKFQEVSMLMSIILGAMAVDVFVFMDEVLS